MTDSLYPTNDTEQLRRLASAADTYLQGQLTAAVAADQRALVLAGFLTAATAAIGGTAITAMTGDAPNRFLGHLALLTAVGLFASMLFAIIAARPVRWFFPGSNPRDWHKDFEEQKSEIESLRELLADYDDRITANHRTMRHNGRWTMAAAILAAITLGAGGCTLVSHLW